MFATSNNLLVFLDSLAVIFSFLLLAGLGVMLLCFTISATMAHAAKQQDDMEQLALKFCHKR
jgi:hypothetical protein